MTELFFFVASQSKNLFVYVVAILLIYQGVIRKIRPHKGDGDCCLVTPLNFKYSKCVTYISIEYRFSPNIYLPSRRKQLLLFLLLLFLFQSLYIFIYNNFVLEVKFIIEKKPLWSYLNIYIKIFIVEESGWCQVITFINMVCITFELFIVHDVRW